MTMNNRWATVFDLWVDGQPKGQPRPRATAINGRVRVYDSGTAEGWKAQIQLAVRPHIQPEPFRCPILLVVSYFLPRPQRLCRRKDPAGPIPHVGKPDLDNLNKALLDSLVACGLLADDRWVVALDAWKWWHRKGDGPGAHLRMSALVTEPVGDDALHGPDCGER
uniref:Putative endodeoxyribonuclease n=1 Tax=viral metagenome TaxID=1070528 RepID=A0A6M3IKD4_9ZZZZ